MNGAYQEAMLWNGQFGALGINANTEANWTAGTPIETNNLGYEGLEIQAIAGLNVHRMLIDGNDLITNDYKTQFDQSFPEVASTERYSREYAGLAIAAYERTILSNRAPFQKWLDGDDGAMTEAEKRGALLFFDKANCNTCHNGPALNSMEFHALGMNDLHSIAETTYGTGANVDANLGRGSFTKSSVDNYKFKVPQII